MTKLTFAPGIVHLPNGRKVTISKILCDTGALHGSYISTDFYSQYLRSVQHLSQPSRDIVVLADRSCKKKIQCSILLSLTVYDNEDLAYDFSANFNVMDKLGQDMIIGLPVLATSLQKFFIRKLSYHITNSVNYMELPDNLAVSEVVIDPPVQSESLDERESVTPSPRTVATLPSEPIIEAQIPNL